MARPRQRDSKKSKEDILKAAEAEFAAKGLHGARVDEIAGSAGINKRMIYEYFGGKEELYKAVLAHAYGRLSRVETGLLESDAPHERKIGAFIRLYFEYLSANPSYVNLILWENLNQGRYIRDIDFSEIKDPSLGLLRKTIEDGKRAGAFRKDLDTEQTVFSLLTATFSAFSNRYTLAKLLGADTESEGSVRRRMETATEMFLGYMREKPKG